MSLSEMWGYIWTTPLLTLAIDFLKIGVLAILAFFGIALLMALYEKSGAFLAKASKFFNRNGK